MPDQCRRTEPSVAEAQDACRDGTAGAAGISPRATDCASLAERRCRWLIHSSSEGMWRFELDPPVPVDWPEDELAAAILERSRLAECNPAYARRCGHARPEDLIGVRLADSLAGAQAERLDVARAFVRGGLRLDGFETRNRDRAGRTFIVLNHVLGLVEDGRLVGGWGTARDITRQRRAEEALRASERHFRSLIENISDVVIVSDADTIVRFASPSVERVLGYSPDEMVGRRAFELIHPDDRSRVAEALARMLQSPGTTSPAVDVQARHADGSWHCFEAVGKCQPDPTGALTSIVTLRDVTDRRHAEEVLRDRERRYPALFQSTVEGFAYCRVHRDDDGRAVDWTCLAANHAFERMTGLKEVVGQRIFEAAPPLRDGSPGLLEVFGRVESAGRPEELDFRWLERWLPASVSSPEPGHVVAVFEDVSDRRRVEESLRESEAMLRAFINALPEPALLIELDETIVIANQAMAEALGTGARELVGRRACDLLPPALAAQRRARLQEAIRTGTVVRWEDERAGRRFLNHACPALDDAGRTRRLALFALDLTELRLAEERLGMLATAVEQAADDIVVTDAAGIIAYVNSAFERTTGYSRDEAIGRSPQFLDAGRHDTEFYRAIDATILAGRTWQGRFVNRTRDGRVILQEATISPIRDGAGQVVGQVSARRDITRQVEMEERAAQADKLEAIGTLAGGIAHDFNNILSAIVGYTQMALRRCATGSPTERDLQAVLLGAQRATDLVRQILAFSRQHRQEAQPVQPGPLVKEAAKLLRASIPATIEIRLNVQSTAMVLADPTEIHRVVVNLATNAALAMQEQGGLLEVGLEDGDLDAASAAEHPGVTPGRFVHLTVRDTGCGMTRDVMARIFEPFFTTRELGKGTGMGLAVVHGIVTRCGGVIRAESRPGGGTTFHVFLPALQRPAPVEPVIPDIPCRGSERILVVDDESIVSGMVVELLSELGYRAEARSNGAEALAAVEANAGAVDLVITDMTMPGMTGDVLAKRLKNLRPDLPVILCTGYSERMTAEQARSQGIDGFAMKPVGMTELSRLVRSVLDGERSASGAPAD